ncbi:uncharacterized protein LOC118415574 [Branchiostoma floridae]|uniref:Uncharacterized protein LOC118415574 n=1 Tax=Branchiostoma floridae TaxID=7739 RepID=A0A9J7MR40_BRAFL|nr:uncharacterized protein LOC118415574 [Branchiostoma floridae]XP_035676158.1 uncharacterized protein LOC118415574 [Branchiostoma floridae]XP_035676160.1 uncharacterized protein LOC118415574 [Branchiostoma floridae]
MSETYVRHTTTLTLSEVVVQNKLLKELSSKLAENEIEELKFLVIDVFPKTELSRIYKGLALFVCQLGFLEKLLQIIGREDLVKIMEDTYKDDATWRTNQPLFLNEHPTPYRTLLYELGKEMKEDDMEIVKFMFKEDLGESILEKVRSPFDLLETLEDHGKIGPPNNVGKLEEAMKMAGRDDLVIKLKEFSSKSDDAARLARRRKDTPWVSKSPFVASNQPQVVEEEEEEEEDEEGAAASSNSDSKRRLSTIPENGPKRAVLAGNMGAVPEETREQDQEDTGNRSCDKTSPKDIPTTTSGKKKSSKFCVLL